MILKMIKANVRCLLNFNKKNLINSFNGKRKSLLILGNGPSLKDDLAKIKSNLESLDVLAVNNFAMSSFYVDIKPVHYVLLCPAYLESVKTGEDLTSDQHLAMMKIINPLITDWKIRLYVPQHFYKSQKFIELVKPNPNISLVPYNAGESFFGIRLNILMYKLNWSMPKAQNVLTASLYISILMNYSKVFLLGVDHTWHKEIYVDQDNTLYVSYSHFYGNKDKAKFYKFEGSNEVFKISEFFQALSDTYKSYEILEQFANSKSVAIFNCTDGSFVDAFRKRSLEKIYEK